MYLLDTNIVSELRKGIKADRNVISWAGAVSTSSLFLSVITILEIEAGVLQKERKDPSQGAILRSWLNAHVLPSFPDRILNIDVAVAQRCAKLHIPDPRSERDALIAATALVHGLIVVTRNIKDFNETGVELLNPWEVVIQKR
jgi:predicted nucleic acid-binding protein